MSMPGQPLDGKSTALYHDEKIRKAIRAWEEQHNSAPQMTLATVQFGDAPDVMLYSKALGRTLAKYGVRHLEKQFSSRHGDAPKALADLSELYQDPSITGVLVYSPIPPAIGPEKVFLNMPLEKDVEGRTFLKRNPFGVFSPTAKAVMALLSHLERIERGKFSPKEKNAVMIGHSDLVGKPSAILLSDAGATVTICHQYTPNLPERVAEADILVVAIGKPRYIQGSWIKKGAVVVDVGENWVDGRAVGDVDFESALQRASYVSPVPGGVGPLTNLMVIENLLTLHAFKHVHGNL